MSTHTGESARRYKLRVNFVGTDAYENDGDALPFRKLIYLANSNERVGDVRQGIKALFTKLYPEDGYVFNTDSESRHYMSPINC